MSTRTETRLPLTQDGNRQAFLLLRTVFTVAPILFGLDKFVRILTPDWERYLAPWMDAIIPGDARTAMLIVGAIEIVAGVVVAFLPRFGGYLVAAWLFGIIISLVSVGGHLDVALRDFGLLIGALALARLASAQPKPAAH
ncbi:DoxX family protein [Microbacterium sp. HM58-2]|nr:DoxX family protein [Microbacterium sp. HM58-2]